MAKILRFRKDREQAKGQKALFEAGDVAPPADLVLRSPGSSDATPHGPSVSDASPLGAGDRLESGSPEAVRRLLRRRRVVVTVLGVIFLGSTSAAIFADRGYLDVRARHHQLTQLQAAVADQQERVIALKREVDRLKTDPAAVERIAREKLGYVLPGEITLVLPSEPGASRVLEAPSGSAIVPRDSSSH